MSLEHIASSTGTLDRAAVSRDLWPIGTLEFWQGVESPYPDRVFWPTDAEQVLQLLRAASEASTVVVPYGAGSGVCGGARGRKGAWVLDCKRLNHIGPLCERSLSVRVQAGVNGQHLEDWLNHRGYTLGHSPSSIWCSTVGGWAAARGAGQFSSLYGVFEDMVLGLQVVSPGGGVQRVGKGGLHDESLLSQIIGSEGTLGVIVELELRVAPLPEVRRFRAYSFASVHDAVQAMRELMQAELSPSVVRLYDPVDTRIGGKTKPKREHKGGGRSWLLEAVDRVPGLRGRSIALPLALPWLINKVLDGLSAECLLIVGWEGDASQVEVLHKHGCALLAKRGEDLGAEPGERWYDSRHAVSYKLMPIFERGGFVDTMEVACRWSQLIPLYDAVRAAVRNDVMVMAHMSHLYSEGGSIYFSFAGRGSRKVYERVWRNALAAVAQVGGTATHHHGVGMLKARAATREVGAAVRGYWQTKARLDPNGVMNPGRVFGVDEPVIDAIEPPPLADDDGLVCSALDLGARERACRHPSDPGHPGHPGHPSDRGDHREPVELMFPWASLPPPPRWQRARWQVGWTEVSGAVDGHAVRLGRGPRSAAGSDLRSWLVQHGDKVRVAVPVVPAGERWMGSAEVPRPWTLAHDLLRSGLRPAALHVRDGRLVVGFRGPAAAELGELAGRLVPGGLSERPYVAVTLPSIPMEPCELDDPAVCWVTPEAAFRPRQVTS